MTTEVPQLLGDLAAARRHVADRQGLALDEAGRLLVNLLRSGMLGATVVNLHGARRAAEPADFTDDCLDFGDTSRPGLLIGGGGLEGAHLIVPVAPEWLEISLPDIDRATDALFRKPSTQEPIATPAQSRGGRPAVHDWRRAMRQVLLRVREYGWPETKSELIAELIVWFSLNFDEPPDESTVRRFVVAIWPQGRCELQPRE